MSQDSQDDRYDDGLVHAHDWAREPPRPGLLAPPAEAGEGAEPRRDAAAWKPLPAR